MAAASATLSPATLSATPAITSSHHQRRIPIPRVKYITGLNSFNGLKAHNNVAQLGLPLCTDFSFAKIVNSFNRENGSGGGAMALQCNAAAEIFKIAAIMNGLTLVGVAVGFVLLRIEAFVEESE